MMNSMLAIIFVLALFLGLAALLMMIARRRHLAVPAALAGLVALGVAGLAHTGGWEAADPAWFRNAATDEGALPEGRCAELVDLLEDNRVILSREGARITVAERLWEQVPPPAQGVVVRCLAGRLDLEEEEIEIIPAGGGAP